MTRIQLAGNSSLPPRFIISVERGKVASGGDLCQLVRLACGLKYPVGRFFDELIRPEAQRQALAGVATQEIQAGVNQFVHQPSRALECGLPN
jgi:hypothetical protein